jgi:hypothetical protein
MKKGKKSKILFFLSSLFLGIFIPVSKAFAFIGTITSLLATPMRVVLEIGFYLVILLGISFALLAVTNATLGWVTSPDFIKVGYTDIENNPVVGYGWTVVRDFTNLLFILVIVAIGIATALRIREYEVKKTLPRLIAVALLINFTPVICGAIIDASNILMNFFLTAGTAGYSSMLNFVQAAGNFLANSFSNLWHHWTDLFNGIFFFQLLFVLVFNFVTSFILGLLIILLLVRHVALWILVILSPLAFFCFILPTTKRVWDKWWHQFIQWCLVGIGGAFFIYLSQVIMQHLGDFIQSPGRVFAGTQITLRNQISALLMFSVPLILLGAGPFVTLSTSAIGASAIIRFARTGGRKAASVGWGLTKGAGRKLGRKLGGVVSPKVREKIESLETARYGEKERGMRGWFKRKIAAPLARGTGKVIRVTTAGRLGLTYEQRLAEEAQRKAEGRSAIENAIALQKAETSAQKAGILQKMAQMGQLKENIKKGRISEKDIIEGFKAARQLGLKKAVESLERGFSHDKEMINKFAQIVHELTPKEKRGNIVGLTKEEEAEGITSYQEKIWRSLKTREDFEQLNFDAIKENKELLDKFTQTMLLNPQQLAEAGRTLGKSFVDAAQTKAEELGPSWFYEINPKTGRIRASGTARYLSTTGAFALGYAPLPGAATREEMEGFVTEARHWETALRKTKTPEEIQSLIDEIETAEREAVNENLKRIISSAREAAEEKLQRLQQPEEPPTPPRRAPRPEAGEEAEQPSRPERRPEAGEE